MSVRRWASVLAMTLVLGASACTPKHSDVPGDVVDAQLSAGSAAVNVGAMLRVDVGEVNPSIGDSWYVVEGPDAAVLTDQGSEFVASDDGAVGGGGRLIWTFTAAGAGTTTVVFRYCYRSSPDHCESEPSRGPEDPVPFAVTVS